MELYLSNEDVSRELFNCIFRADKELLMLISDKQESDILRRNIGLEIADKE